MHVGVLLSRASPDTGGGFTFEHEVLDSLMRCAGESQHSFSVFTAGRGAAERAATESVKLVSLTRRRKFVEQARRGAHAVARLVTANGLRQLRYGNKTSWQERPILDSGVEMMWYLALGAATMEVPYITVVWDLQHRLQPYFPEVSHSLEWERRERSYGTVLRRATAVITGTAVAKRKSSGSIYWRPNESIFCLTSPHTSLCSGNTGRR